VSLKIGQTRRIRIEAEIDATALAAGTAEYLAVPISGTVVEIGSMVATAIVTGGTITAVKGASTDLLAVAGWTIADSAAVKSIVTPALSATAANLEVTKGDVITFTPGAAFNGGGAIKAWADIETRNDWTPAVGN